MSDLAKDMERRVAQRSDLSPWRHYVGFALFGFALALMCFVGTFAALEETGNLPPPALANSICIDEKLTFMRDHRPMKQNFLIVGSSVAWRHVDSSALERRMPSVSPFNGAFCGLRITQTAMVTAWLLGRMPSVTDVLLVASPEDFESCSREPRSSFDIAEADRYVFQDSWRWGFYFRYFDPVSLYRNARNIAEWRASDLTRDTLVMTKYGDSPLDPRRSSGLVYDAVKLDPQCFAALRVLAQDLASRSISFTMVTTPVHPHWIDRYDSKGWTRDAIHGGIDAALQSTGGRHWFGDAAFHEGPEAFLDAIHLRWPAAQRFTGSLIQHLLAGQQEALR